MENWYLLGAHIRMEQVSPSLLSYCPIVVCVDCGEQFLKDIRAAMPQDSWLVVRRWMKNQPLENPKQAAYDWWNVMRPFADAVHDDRTVFQGYNEIGDARAQAYLQMEMERLSLLHSKGLGSAVGGWSVGVPDYPVWKHVYAPLIEAQTDRDMTLIHEYWPDEDGLENPDFVGRWRNQSVLPLLIGKNVGVGEIGRDVLWVNGQALGKPGWHKGGVGKASYIREIGKYLALCANAKTLGIKMIGAAIFTLGNVGPWASYEVNSLWPYMMQFQKIAYEEAQLAEPDGPQNETPTPVDHGLEKMVYWMEESIRQIEKGNQAEGLRILKQNVDYGYKVKESA